MGAAPAATHELSHPGMAGPIANEALATAVGAAPAATHELSHPFGEEVACCSGPCPASSSGPEARQATVGAAPAATRKSGFRCYVIWHIPERPDFFGVVLSAEPGAWDHVARLLRNGEYPGSGAHLRRALDYNDAYEMYRREHRRFRLPAIPPCHRLP